MASLERLVSGTSCSLEGVPVAWSPGAPFVFEDRDGERVRSDEVAMDARLLSHDAFVAKLA